ncbi:phosphatidylcholine transfer protein, putative [Eimeria acervulina]|uniref:Phosphatidylcholine transfer protein, putative n=1 Tax=Eimeria acervulina TaxID=5801 RepID=U6GF18_EIMAC|nr:phosphatidylcholine transfer protein, putative [Eimeria acervulina]CDI78117.1 phosphatidylcholine transfer protein, putative [Eimeria acervulina]
MANDMCRLRKKTSAATQQKKKIDHLIRWAGYHFASSNAQLQLIFKVIMEYEVLARLGDISKTARAQLRLLYSFLSRDDVGHCLWLYLDYFEAHYDHMTRNEICMCAMVCYVCTQCAGTLRRRNLHPVVLRMIRMMNDAEIQKIFQKSKTPNPRQAKLDERTERCLFYADNSQGVQTFVMKGGDLLQSLHYDCTAGRNAESSDGGSFTDAFSGSNFESDESNGAEEKPELVQETLAGELRPLENFNVALTYGVSVERALGCTLDGTNSSAPASVSKQLPLPPSASTAVKTQRRKTSSVVSNTRSTSRASRHPTQSQAQTQTQTQTEDSTTEDKSKARLFRNYDDLINFDTALKHQTPIAAYEFQFLEEKEPHDPLDPTWERTVDQPLIQVYKFISPNSPVIIVKAYAHFEGIPLNVLSHHIKEINCRLHW